MVETVAKALCASNGSVEWEREPQQDIFRDLARAAISAMREPTDEMVEAAMVATASWRDIQGSALTVNREKARIRFRAMVDVALGGRE